MTFTHQLHGDRPVTVEVDADYEGRSHGPRDSLGVPEEPDEEGGWTCTHSTVLVGEDRSLTEQEWEELDTAAHRWAADHRDHE